MTQFQNFDVLKHKIQPGFTLVEASAGTGKTYSITWLVVRLLLDEIEISEILLTTFTVAATEELKQRIRSHLSSVLAIWFEKDQWIDEIRELYLQCNQKQNPLITALSEEDIDLNADFWVKGEQLLRRGLGKIEEATIATIHGFCTSMLKDYTIESAVETGKIESNLNPLYEEIIEDYRSYILTTASLDALRIFNQFQKALQANTDELKNIISYLQKGGWHAIWLDDYPMDIVQVSDLASLNHPEKLVEIWDQVSVSLYENIKLKVLFHLKDQQAIAQFKMLGQRMEQEAEWKNNVGPASRISSWQALDEVVKGTSDAEMFQLVIAHYEKLQKLSTTEFVGSLSKSHKKKNQAFFEFTHSISEGLNDLVGIVESHQKSMRVYFRNIFVHYGKAELEQRKKQKNIMGMDDLILLTHQAIFREDGLFKEALQSRFKAGLIDEFQDTDPMQWGIFKSIFEKEHQILYLIGDPKQSIYRFRGADLNAYLAVKKQIKADRCFTMSRNFRSDPNILSVFNRLFDRNQLHRPAGTASMGMGFFLDPYVPYIQIDAGKKNRYAGKAVKFVHFAQNESFKSESMPEFIAGEVRKFLDAGHTIGEGDKKRAVTMSDIGILSRSNKNANLISQELYKRGIPSTVKSTESVFKTSTAKAFENLLRGMLMPADEGAFKAALSIPFFNYTADQIKKASESQKYIFIELHQIWMSQGIAAAIHALLYHPKLQIIPKILRQFQGAQQLTHLMHLAERLQAKALEDQISPELTLNWLREKRLEEIDEADALDQVRPHLDEAAVEVVTVHKSKGLEYPILFCPDLWTAKSTQKPTIRVLDPDREGDGKILDLRLEEDSSIQPLKSEAQEKLDIADNKEARRLLYVALTRAVHHCCIYLHFTKKDLPLYDLIRGEEEKRITSNEINLHLKEILEKWDQDPNISVEYHHHLGIADTEMLKKGSLGEKALAVHPHPMPTQKEFVKSSFSALAHLLKQEKDFLDEDPVEEQSLQINHLIAQIPQIQREQLNAQQVLFDQVPLAEQLGFHPLEFGRMIHLLLEKIDYQKTDEFTLRLKIEGILEREGITEPFKKSKQLYQMIFHVLTTPLGKLAQNLKLMSLDKRHRQNEFLFEIQIAKDEIITADQLNHLFLNHCENDLVFSSEQRNRFALFPKDFQLTGLLKGFIDLLFKHPESGQYFVVDFKSNLLNQLSPQDQKNKLHQLINYHPLALREVVIDRLYFLQALIYTLALYRLLKHSHALKTDHPVEIRQKLGGVLFLFTRGMMGDKSRLSDDSVCGVFEYQPPVSLLLAMDLLFSSPKAYRDQYMRKI